MIVFDCSSPTAPRPVASFNLSANGVGYFTYDRRHLERPDTFSLDPRHLPLHEEKILLPLQPDGSFGVLSDAGPDAWGDRLTRFLLRKEGRPISTNLVESRLQSQHFGSGCLAFSANVNDAPRLGKVSLRSSDLSARVLNALMDYVSNPMHELDADTIDMLRPGSDLGGLRPKTVVIHEGREHIAKFDRPDDLFDVPAAECATLRLAHEAGIDVPDFELVRIGRRSVLLVERFDRSANGGRIHYLSANSMLRPRPLSPDGREYKTSFSYAAIAESLRPRNDDAPDDAHALFRRMVLNIMVGNVDDHLRNHAMLMRTSGVFRLSPAFDLCPHLEAPFRGQNIGVGALGTASTVENALSQCGRFLQTRAEAMNIVLEVKEVASRWRQVFADAGISEADRYRLAACFAVAEEASTVQVNLGEVGNLADRPSR